MPPASNSSSDRIATIVATIGSERKNLDGAKAVMRAIEASSRNEAVMQQAQNEMRAAQAAIKFLEEELARLQLDEASGSSSMAPTLPHINSGGGGSGGGSAGSEYPNRSNSDGAGGGTQPLNIVRADRDRPLPPPPPGSGGPADSGAQPGGAPKYSQLDLLRYEAPLTGAKITRMLNQLQFKLQVEEQYKAGIERMANAYRAEGDRRLRQETDAKRIESDGKIQLLRKAKRRYETLAQFGAVEDDDDLIPDAKRKDALRKPISGQLLISLRSARDLNHRTLARRSRTGTETTVVIKIEGNERAVSHPARNNADRWMEDFNIPVERANEVEITIYDTIAPGDTAPIGMFWFRVSDLLEALRRQKVQGEAAGPGWVTAEAAASLGGRQGSAPESATLHQGLPGAHGGAPASGKLQEGIEGWFSVEPAGAIQLQLNFVKDTVAGGRRPYEALGRQGALRKRKGDVHEMNGHKFIQRQFYQPIMCALCGEFLLTGEGYQCEDCRYACHKKCYPKVVTKCISKSNLDGEGDEEKINHRIPHRFQAYTNISANWCCHCGYMLPFGRKNSVKCNECALTCHQSCSHLVPDFCGMTMEMANTLLKNLRDIKTTQTQGGRRPAYQQHPSQPSVQVTPPAQQQQSQTQTQQLPHRTSYSNETRISPQPSAHQHSHSQSYNDYNAPQGQQSPQQKQRPVSGIQQPPQLQTPPSFESRPALEVNTTVGAHSTTGSIGQPQPPPRIPSPQPHQPQQPHQALQQQPSTQGGYRPPAGVSAPMPMAMPTGRQQQAQQAQQQQQQYQRPAPPLPQQPLQAPPKQQAVVQQQPPQQQQAAMRKRKIGLDDFNFLAVLGKGNFGKVMLAEERRTNNLYAIKVLKKEFIIENDEVESTQSEKRVFLAAAQERHPFLLGLHSCFQTETRVYFVMEYVSGGDLMLHIQRRQFTLRQAKYYACEVLLALQYFHSKGIIYRDLKLDNILLTLDGHVKVADYGLCKEEMWWGKTTTTFCGTPEFMAPEILQEQPYGRAVDWWAFGVLTYEMLLGQSPFRGDDEDEIFDAIIEDEPLYPITMPRDAVSLLQKLLTRDPARRLGAGEADAEEIKRHQFFSDVNFDDVYHKRIPPPYFPSIGNPTDTSNFDQEFTREQPTLTPVHTQLTAQDQQEFAGFSWIAPWAAN